MKGSFKFDTIAEAQVEIGKWIAQERRIFETSFMPKMALVPAER